MKYSVVHSKDPYLLARLATDLQMEGVAEELEGIHYPFHENEIRPMHYLHTCYDNTFSFHNHDWCAITKTKDRHELTESNYLKVLTQILEP